MMTLYKANDGVRGGTYLNLSQGEFMNIPTGGAVLRGQAEARYIRVPTAAVLVLGPILGLMFVIFLPMAVPLVLLTMAMKRLGSKVERVRDTLSQVIVPRQIGVAAVHHGLGEGKDRDEEEGQLGDLIARLEREINERRTKQE